MPAMPTDLVAETHEKKHKKQKRHEDDKSERKKRKKEKKRKKQRHTPEPPATPVINNSIIGSNNSSGGAGFTGTPIGFWTTCVVANISMYCIYIKWDSKPRILFSQLTHLHTHSNSKK